MRRLAVWCVAVLLLAGCTGSPPPAKRTATPGALPPLVPRTTDPALVESLLARPMRLPRLAAGEPCPVATPTMHTPADQPASEEGLGGAPLYPLTFYLGRDGVLKLRLDAVAVDGLYEQKVVWGSSGSYTGPAVVRVGRLDGPGRGVVKLYYEESASRGDAVVFRLPGSPVTWPSGTYVSGPGCFAYQIDGDGFSEIVSFRVVR